MIERAMSGENGMRGESPRDTCPWLVPVIVDRLWTYPLGVYCRRPDHRIRVPAGATLARVCTTAGYLGCAGYRASAREPIAQAEAVERLWCGGRRARPA